MANQFKVKNGVKFQDNTIQTTAAPSLTGTGASGTWAISITGNAATATTLQTARTIGGISFNGSANINLPGVNTAGNQNTSGNAATVTNGVYTVGNQSIAGIKTFTNNTASTNTTTGSVVVTGGVGVSGNVNIGGALNAITKSFVIDHPTKPNKKLQYGSLEGPEYGVYVRGKLTNTNVIVLPDYWAGLIDPNTVTVSLTSIGTHQNLFVEDISNNQVVVGNGDLFGKEVNCFYVVYAERKDINKLQVEIG
jgi:hypothetical protein